MSPFPVIVTPTKISSWQNQTWNNFLHVQNLGEAGALVEQTIQPGEAEKDRFFQLEKKKKSNHLKRSIVRVLLNPAV